MTLELQKVSAGYGGIDVIHGIDLTVRPGEIVTLVGANGAGKSTLVKTISGLVPVRSGTIGFDGQRMPAVFAAFCSVEAMCSLASASCRIRSRACTGKWWPHCGQTRRFASSSSSR